MPDVFDTIQSLDEAMDKTAECIDDMYTLGAKRAESERAYRIAKQQRMLFERNHNGTPVTILNDVVKGYEDIANLKYNLDCAISEYDANYEAVLFWKKRIEVYRDILRREWSQAGEA